MAGSTKRRKSTGASTARHGPAPSATPPSEETSPTKKALSNPQPPPLSQPRPFLHAGLQAAETKARARALSDWRRQEQAGLEPVWFSADRPVESVLSDVLGKLRLEQRFAESQIIQVWNRCIDPRIAAHAQPAGLHKGTLFVHVDSNVWLSELVRYGRFELLERLQLAIGRDVVQRISFRLG